MIDLSEIVADPDFAQPFTILRSTGKFVAGGYEKTETPVPAYGVITVARDKDIQMLPEGDRLTGAISISATQPLYVTQVDNGFAAQPFGAGGFGASVQRISDVVLWHGEKYRVMSVGPWQDFGYYSAIAVRMAGN